MKFSFTKNLESECFIKHPNLTKKKKKFWRMGGAGGVARVSDFFFPKESKKKKILADGRGWGCG